MPTILIIDDSLMVRQQLSRLLGAAGFAVITACDGIDGLEKLEANADIALVVCDVNMPRMSGLEFLEHSPGVIPVVMLTTEGEPALMMRAKALGAKAWLVKPFQPAMMVAAVKKLAPLPSATGTTP